MPSPKAPIEIIRDLLAIARALHATRHAEGASAEELDKFEAAGKALVMSLSMSHLPDDSVGGRAAWVWAEKGLALLGEALCNEDASARVFVSAWRQRFKRDRSS
jgi:hypothetical protein